MSRTLSQEPAAAVCAHCKRGELDQCDGIRPPTVAGECVTCSAARAVMRAVNEGTSFVLAAASGHAATVLAGRPTCDEADASVSEARLSVVAVTLAAQPASAESAVVLAVDLDGDAAATCPLFEALLRRPGADPIRERVRHVYIENADLLTAADFDAIARVAPRAESVSASACEIEFAAMAGRQQQQQQQQLFPAACTHVSLELHGSPMPGAVVAACFSATTALRVLDLTLHQGADVTLLVANNVDVSSGTLEQLAWRDHAAGAARSIQLPPIVLAAVGASLTCVEIPFGCTPQHLAACAYSMPALKSATVGGPALTNASVVELLCESSSLRHLAVLRAPAVSRHVALLDRPSNAAASATCVESLVLSEVAWDGADVAIARDQGTGMTDEALAAFFATSDGAAVKWPHLRTLRFHEAVPEDIPRGWRQWLLEEARRVAVSVTTGAHKAVM